MKLTKLEQKLKAENKMMRCELRDILREQKQSMKMIEKEFYKIHKIIKNKNE